MFLGLVKLLLGLLFGNSLYQLLKAFPQPLLGSLMIFSGAEMPPLSTINVSKPTEYMLQRGSFLTYAVFGHLHA